LLLAESINATPSPTVTHVATLSGFDGSIVLWAACALVVSAGLVVILGRAVLARNQPDQGGDSASSIVRAWIAISLVAGLLVFCAVAFAIDDGTLRSTLFGGLITSVGAAVAFYFSSKSADQARQDVISVALGTTDVPDLIGTPPGSKTVGDARVTLSQTALALLLKDPQAADSYLVTGQSPVKGTEVRNGSKVSVDTTKPK
jgi:hypothetical protein